jgi:hypothetical protein
VLTAQETSTLIQGIAQSLAMGPPQKWWWAGLASSRAIPYEDGKGLDVVARIAAIASGPLFLVATDDEPPPWIALSGPLSSLRQLLEQARYFEFFIVDSTMRWIVFDTHHNEVVVYGTYEIAAS